MIIIGVDVGGTNTDTVLLENGKIIGHSKVKTTLNVSDGIVASIKQVLELTRTDKQKVRYVNLSTTHMLNALLQGHVSPVGIIRIGAPSTTALPPQCDWTNKYLAQKINGYTSILSGGYLYDGNVATPLNNNEIIETAAMLKHLNLKHAALTGVFSQLAPQQELKTAEILRSLLPDLHISLSYTNDGGLLERENMTVTIAALHDTFQETFKNITTSITKLGLNNALFFVSHNDGTLASLDKANPFLTLKSGPTNSLRGAGILCADKIYALVVDIGGTSTDAGIIIKGEPIEKNALFNIAGINFKSPTSQVDAIALGGGTVIELNGLEVSLGHSIANQLAKNSLSFGGELLTVTDIAIAHKRIKPKGCQTKWIATFSKKSLKCTDDYIHRYLGEHIIDVWSSVSIKPNAIILVGGGAHLFDMDKLRHILANHIPSLTLTIPRYAHIANAVGAATAEIAGSYTAIYDLTKHSHETACEDAKLSAMARAYGNGACSDSIRLKAIATTNINYIPGTHTKIQAKVAGKPRLHLDPATSSEWPSTFSTIYNETQIPTETEFSQTPPTILKLSNNTQQLNHNHAATVAITKQLHTIAPLSNDAIQQRAIGFDFLGSGGGGSTRLSKLMVDACLKLHKSIKELPLEDLPDDAWVICCGFIGSPAIFEENPPSIDSLINSVLKMQAISNKKINAIIAMEGGGANGLVPYVVAAELNIPIVNADAMGRAFPGINMITPAIYNSIEHYTATLSSTLEVVVIHANTADELEYKARQTTRQLGAMAFLSFYPLSGKTVKEYCINNTPQLAEAIGRHFINSKKTGLNPLNSLNKFLIHTDYGIAEELFQGRIVDIKRSETNGFSLGGIKIINETGHYDILFQNENIIARKICTDGGAPVTLACVPDLITIVDSETFEPIGTPEYTFGRKVRVITMGAPAILKTDHALKIVGPASPTYQVNEILHIFDSN